MEVTKDIIKAISRQEYRKNGDNNDTWTVMVTPPALDSVTVDVSPPTVDDASTAASAARLDKELSRVDEGEDERRLPPGNALARIDLRRMGPTTEMRTAAVGSSRPSDAAICVDHIDTLATKQERSDC